MSLPRHTRCHRSRPSRAGSGSHRPVRARAPRVTGGSAVIPALRRTDADTADFTVAPGRADLWLARCPADAVDRSVLNDTERARADAFVRPSDGELYATAHVVLRLLLARYTGTPAHRIRFGRAACPGCGGPHGPPVMSVVPGEHVPCFSLSHGGGVALVGVAAGRVGVDVERLPGAATVDVCARSLHPDERAELAAAGEGDERRRHFGRVWTRKESFLKGLGTGMCRHPSRDYLGADTTRHPEGWTLIDVFCAVTHAAAALHGPRPDVVDLRWIPEAWMTSPPSSHPTHERR